MSGASHELEAGTQLVRGGKISRRDFVRLGLAAGLSATAAEALFVRVARAEPKRGGAFRFGISLGSTTDSLDPATYPDLFSSNLSWTIGNGLTEISATGEVAPDLAESFEPNDNATIWVFKLRKGVTFHNGRDVKAADVVASYRHHMAPGTKSAAKPLLKGIKDIDADGDNVIFELDAGNADFPFYTSDYHLPVMPSDGEKVDWQSGIRTGPFVLKNFEPGIKLEAERFANYHGHAWFDSVTLLSIKDVAARTAALVSGDVHYIDRCDLKTLDMLQRRSGIEISETAGLAHYLFAMNVNAKPFNDRNVRLALKHGIDRQAIVDKIYFGKGQVGNDNPISSTVEFAIDPMPRHEYDPEKAKSLLKRAGFDRLSVDLSTADSAFAGAVDACLLAKDSAAKSGIDINVVREASDGYWDNVWQKKPWVATYSSGRPTCDQMFTTFYAGDAPWNDCLWKNERFDALLKLARSEVDKKKRAEMYAEMQQIQHDDGGALIFMFNSYVSAHADTLGHGKIASNIDADGAKISSRWWFK